MFVLSFPSLSGRILSPSRIARLSGDRCAITLRVSRPRRFWQSRSPTRRWTLTGARRGPSTPKGGPQESGSGNLIARVREVSRAPAPPAPGSSEFAYRSVQRLGPSDSVAPLGGRGGAVRVADLLP